MRKRGSAQDPLWYKDAIIYETHVKAFFDSNNDGNGDFGGLIRKLDYLEELGVTSLWLLPFFPSPLRDDGYDIADYTGVHPSFGTLEDFDAFLKAAHERSLQVVIEMVINHTSDQHPWFQASRTAPPGSVERDFYVWSDDDRKYKDARIIFTDTEKSNSAWDPVAKAYYWHRFFSHQPDLNYDNPAVIQEILKAMRFWLDRGVDGFRLDAIPYLVEREGGNCENLPETHSVIKLIRKTIEEEYENRMLLAEANQWPAEVRHYFGNEDECHMAYHFPLMPRLFMALRLEDRRPITDIMAQTPEIPGSCQWALFLRNHDELTLEMVSDEERDYMYLAYSADQRMRLNVGIRRRLAPLIDNNRRRIELLNSILFSFPGTPIIYYGDEIGMGDNIYLGDRNGVRTPMQWSADRNAGFSRANPARLYSPVIMDPVYGYESINVEGQQSDTSSLLHWMRNMIALRKIFQVFGRGTLEFIDPANRKLLAYLRRYDGDTILCVANLSRFAQPAELDLASLAGMTPVEMLGYTEFPSIGTAPYRLTLGPYAFYWFELQGKPAAIEVEQPEEPVLAVTGLWEGLFEGAPRKTLETDILPRFLPGRRWFGGKGRKIQSTRLADTIWLAEEPAPFAIALVEVGYAEGPAETYCLPLAVTTGAASAELREARPEALLSAVAQPETTGFLHEAVGAEGLALVAAIAEQRETAGRAGIMRAFSTAAFDGSAAPTPVTESGAEQSNTCFVFGRSMILKVFRRLAAGPHPELEIGRFLTERVKFPHVPRLYGGIEYRRAGEEPVALAVLQEWIGNRGDGWTVALEELARYYERKERNAGSYLDAAARLGGRTAELHLALASDAADPAFAPEPVTAADVAELARGLRERGARVFEILKNRLASLPDDMVELAASALGQRSRLMERLEQLGSIQPDWSRIRIHGDFHLAQVLTVDDDFVIIDFEGEPTRPLAERRRKQSPLKDVAGMMRSFSYAAYAAAEGAEGVGLLAEFWEKSAAAAFLGAYRRRAGQAVFLPGSEEDFARLLEAFMLDKVLYELEYELNHRPGWVGIALRGMLGLG